MYKTITPIKLTNAIHALNSKQISFKAFRAYLAAVELKAIREAASQARKRDHKAPCGLPLFKKEELKRLTRTLKGGITKELKALKMVGLMNFEAHEITITETPIDGSFDLLEELSGGRSPARPIPVPRRVIRFIAGCNKKALALTMIAYIVRGLTLDRKTGEVRGKGTVKSSWIADAFELSPRAVKSARAALIKLGWIGKDTGSHQLKLNRTGAYFVINLDWKPKTGEDKADNFTYRSNKKVASNFAPPPAQKCPDFAHPIQNRIPLYRTNNQGSLGTEPAGVCKQTKSVTGRVLLPPTIKDVKAEDLMEFSRTKELYYQAVKEGLFKPSQAMALNFVAAAIRAKTTPCRNQAKVFIGIIKKGLWSHITQEQEARAQAAILKYEWTNRIPQEGE